MKTLNEKLDTAIEPDKYTGTGGTGMPCRF